MKCPICRGKGDIEKPYSKEHKKYEIFRKRRIKSAQKLLKNGYSIRQVTKMVGYGSTRSVMMIKQGKLK